MRRHLTELPQGRKAARAGGLCRVRGGPLHARALAAPGLASGRVVPRPGDRVHRCPGRPAPGHAAALAPPGRPGRAAGRCGARRHRVRGPRRRRADLLLPRQLRVRAGDVRGGHPRPGPRPAAAPCPAHRRPACGGGRPGRGRPGLRRGPAGRHPPRPAVRRADGVVVGRDRAARRRLAPAHRPRPRRPSAAGRDRRLRCASSCSRWSSTAPTSCRAAVGAVAVVAAGVVLFVLLRWVERSGLRERVHDVSEDRAVRRRAPRQPGRRLRDGGARRVGPRVPDARRLRLGPGGRRGRRAAAGGQAAVRGHGGLLRSAVLRLARREPAAARPRRPPVDDRARSGARRRSRSRPPRGRRPAPARAVRHARDRAARRARGRCDRRRSSCTCSRPARARHWSSAPWSRSRSPSPAAPSRPVVGRRSPPVPSSHTHHQPTTSAGWARQITVVRADLLRKHAELRHDEYRFLRGTYYLWLWRAGLEVPEVFGHASVPLVGDLHVENYGTWRDHELVRRWGVNDLDELARGSWLLDPLRLAVSAVLAPHLRLGDHEVCDTVLAAWYAAYAGRRGRPARGASSGGARAGSSPTRTRSTPASARGSRSTTCRLRSSPPPSAWRSRAGGRPGTSTRPAPARWATVAGSGSGLPRTAPGTPARPSSSARRPVSGPRTRCRPVARPGRRSRRRTTRWSRPCDGPAGAARVDDWQVRDLAPDVVRIRPDGLHGRDARRLLEAMAQGVADVHARRPVRRCGRRRPRTVSEGDFAAWSRRWSTRSGPTSAPGG